MRALVLTAGFSWSLSGCGLVGGCTEEGRSSLSVELERSDGTPIDDATVQYSVDGGDFQDCFAILADNVWICGFEEVGDFVVEVDWNGVMATRGFEIDADRCHVIGQSTTIVLEP